MREVNESELDYLRRRVEELEKALRPFAIIPELLEHALCHEEICTKEECVNCSKKIAAWKALQI